ncbi:hypothetical protein NQZ68_028222 [Dissostichus eleginoides]|nr:hypothetical protein NQZ68_028222 [Dissostichus eleginoides]
MASHYPFSPGFQLHSSHLFQGQQEAVSAASPNLRAAVVFCYSQSPEHLPQRLHWESPAANLNGKSQVMPPFVPALMDQVLAEHEPKTPVRESDRRDWNLFRHLPHRLAGGKLSNSCSVSLHLPDNTRDYSSLPAAFLREISVC